MAVSTLRGTTHVFPITPYGGPVGVRTHTSSRVVNRLSRFHRSAGIIDERPSSSGRNSPNPNLAGTSPVATSFGKMVLDNNYTGSGNMAPLVLAYPNPHLPPYPVPTLVQPLAQLRQPYIVTLTNQTLGLSKFRIHVAWFIFDPPGHIQISAHYLHTLYPYVHHKNKYSLQRTPCVKTKRIYCWGLVGHLKFARLVHVETYFLGSAAAVGRKKSLTLNSSMPEDVPIRLAACFAPSRAWLAGNQHNMFSRQQRRTHDALFIMANHGVLLEYALDVMPDSSKIVINKTTTGAKSGNFLNFAALSKDKICESSPIDLSVAAFGQWNLSTPRDKAELQPPLPIDSALMLATPSHRSDHYGKRIVEDYDAEKWLSQVCLLMSYYLTLIPGTN